MGLELVLIVVGVTLTGGMFIAIATACQESPPREEVEVPKAEILVDEGRGFYAEGTVDGPALSEDRTVLDIEYYLRRERMRAQRFADQPSTESLLHDYESIWNKRASS